MHQIKYDEPDGQYTENAGQKIGMYGTHIGACVPTTTVTTTITIHPEPKINIVIDRWFQIDNKFQN